MNTLVPKISIELASIIHDVQAQGKTICILSSNLGPYVIRIFELQANKSALLLCRLNSELALDFEATAYVRPDSVSDFCRKYGSPELGILLDPDGSKLSVSTAGLPLFIFADGHTNFEFNLDLSIESVDKAEAYATLTSLWSYVCGFVAGRANLDLSYSDTARYIWFLDEYGSVQVPVEDVDGSAPDETYAIKA